MHRYIQFLPILVFSLLLLFPRSSLAAPYFYLDSEPDWGVKNYLKVFNLYLYTDLDTVTAAQTVVNFDNTMLTPYQLSVLNSRCSFWAPADPSLGYGSNPTPYFRDNKAVFSCGFSNPGYISASGSGELIARIVFNPAKAGVTALNFTNTKFIYIGSNIVPDTSPNYDLWVYESTASAPTLPPNSQGTPTPSPGAGAGATPTPTPTPANTTPIFTSDDLEFVEISANSGSGTSTSDTSGTTLTATEQDNSIPAPPANLAERPSATPFLFRLLDSMTNNQPEEGEVLSAQSLRELLIPGKSSADKTVVMVNLISTLTFITLLAIVIWRLISISRLNKLKTVHMQELLTSELAAIESKIGVARNAEGSEQLKQELGETVKKINQEISSKK